MTADQAKVLLDGYHVWNDAPVKDAVVCIGMENGEQIEYTYSYLLRIVNGE